MGIIKLAVLPLVCFAILLYPWYMGWITGLTTVLILAAIAVGYSLVQSIRYGLFAGASPYSDSLPAVKFCYKEYQCDYKEVKEKFMKELKDADHNMLKSKNYVNCMVIYYDNPEDLRNEDQGRACAGFALHGEAEEDIGINKVLEAAKFKAVRLEGCDTETMNVPKVDDMSCSVSIMKTMDKAWANAKEKGCECLFQWEDSKTVRSGFFTGKNSKQYMIHSQPTPEKKRRLTPESLGTKKQK